MHKGTRFRSGVGNYRVLILSYPRCRSRAGLSQSASGRRSGTTVGSASARLFGQF
jgi:hypothetical protein